MGPKKFGAALLVVMLLVGACSSSGSTSDGDDDTAQESEAPEDTPTTEAGPTSEEFIAEAESVCISVAEQSEELKTKLGIPKTSKANFALGAKLLDVRRDRLERLRSLDVSEELQAQWGDYLEVRQNSFDVIEKRYNVLKGGDEKGAAKLLSKADELDEEWQSIGEEIGLSACANKLSPEDEKQITAAITQFFEGEPKKTCSGFVSKSYLEYLGGVDGCLQGLGQASKISTSELQGVDEVFANATVDETSYGKSVSVEVTFEDGKYKVRSFSFL